jgi:hypothetical protein
MSSEYRDRWIECRPDAISLRGYYFPWGTKCIPYASIRSWRRVDIGTFTGKGRFWGTANPHYWANFDPRRPKKRVGFILDLGHFVHPFITPDDPDAFEAAVGGRSALGPASPGGGRGPVI